MLVAVAMAVANMAYQTSRTRQSMALLGTDAAGVILTGQPVQGFRLLPLAEPAPPDAGPDTLTLGERRFQLIEPRPLDAAHGLLHVRRALLIDASYDWTKPLVDQPNASAAVEATSEAGYAFRFGQGTEQVTWVFFPQSRQAGRLGGKLADITPSAPGIQRFCRDQWPQPQPTSPATPPGAPAAPR